MESNLISVFIAVIAITGLGLGVFFYQQSLKKNKKSVLYQYSRDLTKLAQEEKLDPVIGRFHEIKRVIQILSRRTKNNPVLIGASGVGKTAIVEQLAQEIAAGNVPEALKNKSLLSLDLSGLIAGTKYRGEFEQRLKGIVDELKAAERNIIVFIDEVQSLAEAGEATGAIDAADILKPELARGELQVIGATTMEEYQKFIKPDATLARRFQPVLVNEPSASETMKILKGLRSRYEDHHKVKITDEAIEAAVELADQCLKDRYFPDKAIDLIDEAAAKVRLYAISDGNKNDQPQVSAQDIQEIITEWSNELVCSIKKHEEQKK